MIKIDAIGYCCLSGSEILSLTGGSANFTKDVSQCNVQASSESGDSTLLATDCSVDQTLEHSFSSHDRPL